MSEKSPKAQDRNKFPLSIDSGYEGMLLAYSGKDFDKYRRVYARIPISDIIAGCVKYFKDILRDDIYMEALVDRDHRVIFRRDTKYVINATFPKEREMFDRMVEFDPFAPEGFDVSDIPGVLDVYDDRNKLIVSNNAIRFLLNDLSLVDTCSPKAVDFVAAMMCDFVNSEQKWYRERDYGYVWSRVTDFVDAEKVREKYFSEIGDDYVDRSIQRSMALCAAHFFRSDPLLELMAEAISTPCKGWDIIASRQVKGSHLEFYSLGDARILDFEYRLNNPEEESDDECE